ncbi:MAG: MHS family MFS transporter [Leptolyngbya sp. SIO3F4]|nr:MHS family MFS transporter [Leptolyngbya sp. SIO3F4]
MAQLSASQAVKDEQTSQSNNIKKVILAGVVGNVIEWYDFALYGYLAPVISLLFFPNESELVSLLQTYGVFAAGFIMRPIGAAGFGYIGDRIGRRTELFLSIILMAVPTFMLGLLPDYAHIGIAAPIALIILRLVQGLSVGGEFTGSVTYVAETAPQNRRGLTASFANVGSMAGILLGLGIVTVMTHGLSETSLHAWGWRLPFLFGGVLGLVGLYIRQNIPVSDVFQEHRQDNQVSLSSTLKQNLIPMLQAMVYAGGYSTVFYIVLVYLPTYLGQFTDIPLTQALLINTVAIAITLVTIPLMGWLSDTTLRRKSWLLIAGTSLAISGYPAFLLFHQGNILWVWGAQIVLTVLISLFLGISPAMMVELFPTETRLTAYSVSFNLGVSILGGTSPLICTWLIKVSDNAYAPAFYLMGTALMAMVALGFMSDRSREPLL